MDRSLTGSADQWMRMTPSKFSDENDLLDNNDASYLAK